VDDGLASVLDDETGEADCVSDREGTTDGLGVPLLPTLRMRSAS